MGGSPAKRCRNCRYYFLAYRRDGVRELCTYPGISFKYAIFNSRTPVFRDIDIAGDCGDYVYSFFSYIMNCFLLRFLRRERL